MTGATFVVMSGTSFTSRNTPKVTIAALSGMTVTDGTNSAYYTATGASTSSDERLKTMVSDINISKEIIEKIPKKYFYWNNDENRRMNIGTSAQKLMEVYPELVFENDEHYSVDYAKLSIVALAAVEDLYKEIDRLKQEIEDLKK